MILTSLQTNQLTDATFEWYARYLESFEARNLDAYLSFLSVDCVVQSNSRLPYYGHDGLRETLQRYFEAFEVVHELINIYGCDDQFGTEMLTHFTPRGKNEPVVIPTVSFYERKRDGLLRSIRHYVDDAPLAR
ncbi:MAG: nuclear transport factor 2 family protein [Vitreimonas sp.]